MKIIPEIHDPAFTGECLLDAHGRILDTDSFFAHLKRICGNRILTRLIASAFLPRLQHNTSKATVTLADPADLRATTRIHTVWRLARLAGQRL
jgi:hypothetical protein